MAPARVSVTAKLVPETKILDELPIGLQVGALHVLEKPSPPADHLQQALSRVMVLWVRPEVVRQVVDPLGEQGHLHLGRPLVGAVRLVFLDRRCFFESHDVYSRAQPGAQRRIR